MDRDVGKSVGHNRPHNFQNHASSVTFGCNGGRVERHTKGRNTHAHANVRLQTGHRQDLRSSFQHAQKILHPVFNLKFNTTDMHGMCVSAFPTSTCTDSLAPKSHRGCTIQKVMHPVVTNAKGRLNHIISLQHS